MVYCWSSMLVWNYCCYYCVLTMSDYTMKYSVIFDENAINPLQRTDFECDDDATATLLAINHFDKKPGIYTIFRDQCQIIQYRIDVPSEVLTREQEQNSIDRMESILRSQGIRMKIGGCSCCESPWITFEYEGETIINDIEGHQINMFESNG